MLKKRFSFLKIDWRPTSKIPDTLFKHITISFRDVNFSQKSYSVTTGSEENRFLKGFFNFLSCDTCVNNDKEMRTTGLPNIWAFKQYMVYGGSYLSICQRIFTLNGVISYQGTLSITHAFHFAKVKHFLWELPVWLETSWRKVQNLINRLTDFRENEW